MDFEEVTNFKSFVDTLGYIVGDVEHREHRAAVLRPDGGVELVPVADVTVRPGRNNPVVSQYGP